MELALDCLKLVHFKASLVLAFFIMFSRTNIIIFFAFLLFIWVYLVGDVAYAFSTLDACAAKASCAASVVGSSGIRAQVAKTGTVAANNVVKFSRGGTTTSHTFSTAAKALIGFTLTTMGLGYFSQSDVDLLRQQATQKYCDLNPSECQVPADFDLIITGDPNYRVNRGTRNNEIPNYSVTSLPFTSTLQLVRIFDPNGDFNEEYPLTTNVTNLAIEYDFRGSPPVVSWNTLTQEQRNAATGLLTNSEISQQLTTETLDPEALAPPASPDNPDKEVKIIPPPSIQTDGDVVFVPAPLIAFGSGNTNISSPSSVSTTTSNNTTTTTATKTGTNEDGEKVTTTTTTVLDPDGNIIDFEETITVETEEITEQGEDESLSSPEIVTIEPSTFQSVNFLTHGVTVFSNKFPFDIFGTISPDIQPFDDCPTYTFFDRDFELCPIKDILTIFKYPVIIGFLIMTLQNL